jgi:hypothetical protein
MTGVESDTPPRTTPRPRRRWLLPLSLLLLVTLGLGIWISHIETRHLFVGPTDPTTGIHYTFTVAPGGVQFADTSGDFRFRYEPAKPSPLQIWLEEHFGHRTSHPDTEYLTVTSLTGTRMNGYPINEGYPTFRPVSPTTTYRMNIQEQTRLLISGCPATLGVSHIIFHEPGEELYLDALVINVKEKHLMYEIYGTSNEAHQKQVREEVLAIGRSFRIEQDGTK